MFGVTAFVRVRESEKSTKLTVLRIRGSKIQLILHKRRYLHFFEEKEVPIKKILVVSKMLAK